MIFDQKLKALINDAIFLTQKEKEELLSKIQSWDINDKQKLFDFLTAENQKIEILNLKYDIIFEKLTKKLQDKFNNK